MEKRRERKEIMPTYDYYCEKCKTTIEIIHTMSSLTEERYCDCGNKLDRKISGGSGFILKGAGFHKNDYPKT